MIKTDQLSELKEQLELAQNPLFFYDNDADGLCSFLILRRALGRGKGVAIKSFPDLKKHYLKKVDELNPDTIVILDKAEVETEFINQIADKGIPIIWIDHHQSQTAKNTISKTYYFNSFPSSEPVSYISQKIFNRPEDIWLSLVGCIGDVYLPEFTKSFSEENPELLPQNIDAFTALQSSEMGKISRSFNFGLMDTTTNVLKLTKYLITAKTAYDILKENPSTKNFHKRVNQLEGILHKQLQKAELNISKNSKLIFFTYSGDTSMSSEISNRLSFSHKDKLVVVAFLRPEKANISIRGKDALKITLSSIKDILGATGGGHEEATGAMVPISDFQNFKETLSKIVETSETFK